MQTLFTALVPITIGLVTIILLVGLFNMMRGGSSSTSQRMMRARVVAQFAAIIVIMATLWITGR